MLPLLPDPRSRTGALHVGKGSVQKYHSSRAAAFVGLRARGRVAVPQTKHKRCRKEEGPGCDKGSSVQPITALEEDTVTVGAIGLELLEAVDGVRIQMP